MMLSQRVRGAESRIKNKSSNGPPRAQSKGTANGRSSRSLYYMKIGNIGNGNYEPMIFEKVI